MSIRTYFPTTIEKIGILLSLLTIVISLQAQHTNILISTTNTPNEPTICLNPKNPDQIVAGCNLNLVFRANGLPITYCDHSGRPYNGTIYINWSDQRNGPSDTDIWLVKSTDGGATWSQPARVNNDPPGKQQFFTWMTIDQVTGYLWFVFYDRRAHTNNYRHRGTRCQSCQ